MNHKFDNYENVRFKNWIKKRFINEVDICKTPYRHIVLWSEALHELGDELIELWCFVNSLNHQIVPFNRSSGR